MTGPDPVLGPNEEAVLKALSSVPFELDPTQVAELAGILPADAWAALSRLEVKGLVERVPGPFHRRTRYRAI